MPTMSRHSLSMTLEEVKAILKDNGLSNYYGMTIHDLLVRSEGKRGKSISIKTACIAVKLFGVKLKLARRPTKFDDRYLYTSIIGWKPC